MTVYHFCLISDILTSIFNLHSRKDEDSFEKRASTYSARSFPVMYIVSVILNFFYSILPILFCFRRNYLEICVCVCVCACACVYMCVCACVYTHTHTYILMMLLVGWFCYIYIYIYIYIYVYTYIYMFIVKYNVNLYNINNNIYISVVKPTRCTCFSHLSILNNTLHISDGLSIHHQDMCVCVCVRARLKSRLNSWLEMGAY
jgi:hypothetical protein